MDGSKIYDVILAYEFGNSDNESWTNTEREVYTGEAMEKELDDLFPTDRLLEQQPENSL